MTDQKHYPPAHLSHLVRRVDSHRTSDFRPDWTGNDESARNHNGVVALSESPLRLRLSWKRSPTDQAILVGVLDLDLHTLLAEGYVRMEPRVKNSVRLRFYHGARGAIYLQANLNGPAVPVGEVPWN